MVCILIGPPGCGKGTHAPRLAKLTEWVHVSTGDMLRDAVSKKTDAGVKAKTAMESGNLVADEIVIEMIKDRMK